MNCFWDNRKQPNVYILSQPLNRIEVPSTVHNRRSLTCVVIIIALSGLKETNKMMRVFISILFLGLVSCDSSADGIHDGIVDPQKSQDLAMFAVDTINSGSNAEYKSNLVQVNSVRTQVGSYDSNIQVTVFLFCKWLDF